MLVIPSKLKVAQYSIVILMNQIKVTSLELQSIVLLLFMQRLGHKFYFESVGLLFLLLPSIRQNKSTSIFGNSLLRPWHRGGCRVWWQLAIRWPVAGHSVCVQGRLSLWVLFSSSCCTLQTICLGNACGFPFRVLCFYPPLKLGIIDSEDDEEMNRR